jgi:hypothetical protein
LFEGRSARPTARVDHGTGQEQEPGGTGGQARGGRGLDEMIRGPKKLSRRAPSQLQRERSFGVFTVAHVRRFVAVELDGKVAALGGDFHRAVGTSLPNSCQQSAAASGR